MDTKRSIEQTIEHAKLVVSTWPEWKKGIIEHSHKSACHPRDPIMPELIQNESTGDALRRDICINPDDDAPRLIYADWLEENGMLTQATYIRNNISYPEVILSSILNIKDASLKCYYRKGFIEEVHCTTYSFMQVSQEIALKHPVVKWRLLDFQPWGSNSGKIIWEHEGSSITSGPAHGDLPSDLFKLLMRGQPSILGNSKFKTYQAIYYMDEKELYEDLNQACVKYSRKKLLNESE